MQSSALVHFPKPSCRLDFPCDRSREAFGGGEKSLEHTLVEHCARYSPIVGFEPTDDRSLLLDITGLAHFFGGEAALAGEIVRDFARLGVEVRVGIAETIGAAWAAAKYCRMKNDACNMQNGATESSLCILHSSLLPLPPSPFLHGLPIDALRLPDETLALLRQLGIEQIGHLEALPREEFLSRFGPIVLLRLDQMFGRVDEPVRACPIPPKFVAAWSAEHPTDRRETIDAVVEHLTGRVGAMLARRGRGALRLDCRLHLETHEPSNAAQFLRVSVGLFCPTAAAGHLFPLVQLQLERLRIYAPVVVVEVSAPLTAPLEASRQTLLFADCQSDDQNHPGELALLVERLSSRLGRNAVVQSRLRPEAQPELSWHYDPLVGVRRRVARRKTLPGELPPRPTRLLRRPAAIAATSVVPDGPPMRFQWSGESHVVARSWGPERIETGWWRGRPVGRDYFRVETAAGSRLWLFRRLRDGKWFLQGSFE